MYRRGALSYSEIMELIKLGALPGASAENVQSTSLDLVISEEMYRVDGTFLPEIGEPVREALQRVEATRVVPDSILERDVVYIAKLRESVNLPKPVYGYANPKSSTGRIRVHVRLLVDGVPRYDSVPRGHRGELWLSIVPQCMPIVLSEGETLNQIRFFDQDTRLDEFELELAMNRYGLLCDKDGNEITYSELRMSDNDGSIILTLDLSLEQVGWQSFGSSRILDTSKRDFYYPDGFFEPLRKENGTIRLRKDGFYLLQSWEYVRVPPDLACEMVPMDERAGDFRSHEAGFIDSGWGWSEGVELLGRPLTLEVIPFEDLVFRHRQGIAKIRFERTRTTPDSLYLEKKSGPTNYGEQRSPWLSKHFRRDLQIKA